MRLQFTCLGLDEWFCFGVRRTRKNGKAPAAGAALRAVVFFRMWHQWWGLI